MIVDLRPESAFSFFKEFSLQVKYGYWISQQSKLLKRTSS